MVKQYNPHRADSRSIEDKALGLLYAMTDEQALNLSLKLRDMAAKSKTAGCKRAAMFCGRP